MNGKLVYKNIKSFKCNWEMCQKGFEDARACYNHVKTYHIRTGMRECKWNSCKIISSSRCNLNNHIMTHLPVVNGICHLCNRSFKWRCDFKKHQLLYHHDEENKFNNEIVDFLFH